MKTWFEVKARAGNKPAEIFIYQEIGFFGIGADQFITALKNLGDIDQLDLHINSPGGDPFAAAAMYLALKRHSATVNGYVDGIAASAASVVLMAADKIVMPTNTMLMIHNPLGGAFGEAEDLRDFADALDKIKMSILSAYRRSKKTDAEIVKIMDDETWYTAEEAQAHGFADEVIEAMDVAAFFDLGKFKNPPAALARSAEPAPPPAPSPTPAPQPTALTSAEIKLLAKAEKIVDTQEKQQLRADALRDAGAIVRACADAEHPELAARFLEDGLTLEAVKAELSNPEIIATATASYAADVVNEIVKVCAAAGVPDMAPDFIAKSATVEAVRDRLKDADKIRARCVAAGMPHRAVAYIKAGATAEEAGKNLFQLKLAMDADVPEIDNHIGPDAAQGKTAASGNGKLINYNSIFSAYPGGRNGTLSSTDIYARRNDPKATANELIDAIADRVAQRQRSRRW